MKMLLIGLIGMSLLLGMICCRKTMVGAEENAQDLAAATGIPETVLQVVKDAGPNIRQLQGMNDEGNTIKATGVTIDVANDSVAGVIKRLKETIPPGYLVFVSKKNFGFGGKPDSVSVLKAANFSEVVEVMGTNGWNYDISPEIVIERLEKWDRRFGLSLTGAGSDWLEAEFIHPPRDMAEFAKEVYDFCPDVVTQGTESVEALAKEMERTKSVYLWWD